MESRAVIGRRLWSYTSLLVLLLALLIFPHLLGAYANLTLKILFSLAVIASLLAVYEQKKYRLTIALAAAIAILSKWLALYSHGSPTLDQIENVSSFICFFIVTLLILKAIIGQQAVRPDTIVGAVAVYIMLGIMFALLFESIESIYPNSLWVTGQNTVRDDQFYIYFSLVTLTTVGYGDILPLSSLARTFATLEAITGQIYLAVLVALLIGKYLASTKLQY